MTPPQRLGQHVVQPPEAFGAVRRGGGTRDGQGLSRLAGGEISLGQVGLVPEQVARSGGGVSRLAGPRQQAYRVGGAALQQREAALKRIAVRHKRPHAQALGELAGLGGRGARVLEAAQLQLQVGQGP